MAGALQLQHRLEDREFALAFFGPMHKPSDDTNRPFQKGERNRCAAWMPRKD